MTCEAWIGGLMAPAQVDALSASLRLAQQLILEAQWAASDREMMGSCPWCGSDETSSAPNHETHCRAARLMGWPTNA